DPESSELRRAIAAHFALDPAQIFVGNESDEVLAYAFPAFFAKPLPLLFPDITYSFLPVYAQMFGVPNCTVPLADDFSVRLADYDRPCGGIIITNPNAPTGRALPAADLCALLERHPDVVVLVDEAYVDFGGESMAPFVPRYPNLLVVQTVSKSRSLAGIRLGYALGQQPLIDGLNRVKSSVNSYPVDRICAAAVTAAFADPAPFRANADRIIATRERVAAALPALGFSVVPSAANFLFISHRTRAAADLYRALKERGVLVRHFSKPRIDNYLRVTIGTDEEMDVLLTRLREILG
ncbi:MAG TPA: histidinol-phosphate transaminase, partial [bacterium]|nr:histidinol-phosphate transaminase [bacterium]